MASKERNTCSQADPFCLAPAAWGVGAGYSTNRMFFVRTRCPQCDEPVCRNCSSIRKGRRLCHECVIDHDGSSVKVMDKLYKRAGR